MKISEICITLRDEEKLKAFANITFDDCFVIRGLKVIQGSNGYFVSMPSRRRGDGTYCDVAHPTNQETRKQLEDGILKAYAEAFAKDLDARPQGRREQTMVTREWPKREADPWAGRLRRSG